VLPLGFRFDVDAVIVDGVAHRTDCEWLPGELPPDAILISASGFIGPTGARGSVKGAGRRSRRC
jgi:hypothetical protein